MRKCFVSLLIIDAILSACGTTPTRSIPTSTSPAAITSVPTTKPASNLTSTPPPVRQQPGGIAYVIPEMELVVPTHKDVSYSSENEDLKLDIYAPPGLAAEARLPVVLFVHGSAPASKNLKNHAQYVSWAKLMGASGLIAVTFNWDYPDPSGIEQVLAFVRAHSDEFHIDPERLCVLAASAGVSEGFTVALKDAQVYLRCIVGYYGDPSPALTEISPEEAAQLPPVLLAQGALDDPSFNEGADRFARELTALGGEVTLLTHERAGHAFDIRYNDERAREIIQQTVEFIKMSLQE
jgi:acetyl esterase/lipase